MIEGIVTKRLEAFAEQEVIEHDAAQWATLPLLDSFVEQVNQPPVRNWWGNRKKSPFVRGVYLWGGVGRGKTWLLEQVFESVSGCTKRRWHFHRFMQHVHDEMAKLSGQRNPLHIFAKQLVSESRLIFLDEFHVTDIGDAMILAGLLNALFEHNGILLTTSNLAPEQLYADGIQRASFLPAIRLLQDNTHVTPLDGERDFRQQYLEQQRVYFTHSDENAEIHLKEAFDHLADGENLEDGELVVRGRGIPYRYQSGSVIWFDYEALCGPPRSQRDYVEVSRGFQSVIISDVPLLDATRDDSARRFLFLVDEFYDRRVKLILSAAVGVEQLYCGERLAFEFKRTASRLGEMQGGSYLGEPHRP